MVKRKALREHKGIDGNKQKQNDSGIEKLPDELLIDIVSRLSLKDAVKTSVLSSKWENLWKFASLKLEFNSANWSDTEMFRHHVDKVLYLYQGTRIDSLIVRFSCRQKPKGGLLSGSFDDWINFAMLKEAKRFEFDLSVGGGSALHCYYRFPDLMGLLAEIPSEKWSKLFCKSGSFSHCLRSLGAFCSLRSLRLVNVHIKDEVVRYILASCHYLEQLCIKASDDTKNVEVVDPLPNLKELEISNCSNIRSLVISVVSLVSCKYGGREIGSPIFENLSKLTLSGEFCESFIYEPNKHSSYSAQLVELVLNLEPEEREERGMAPPEMPPLYALKRLELNIPSQVNRSLLFFTSLIKASPQLQELKMKIEYLVPCQPFWDEALTSMNMIPFPEVTAAEANVFHHENLKVVSVAGYCGCASEDEFLVQLYEIAPALETLFIDTDCDYYLDLPDLNHFLAVYKLRQDGDVLMRDWITKREEMPCVIMTASRARKHARKLKSSFPSKINFLIA